MVMSNNTKRVWKTVQIPKGLFKQVQEFIKTDEAQNLGITSVSAYVVYIIRKSLDD